MHPLPETATKPLKKPEAGEKFQARLVGQCICTAGLQFRGSVQACEVPLPTAPRAAR